MCMELCASFVAFCVRAVRRVAATVQYTFICGFVFGFLREISASAECVVRCTVAHFHFFCLHARCSRMHSWDLRVCCIVSLVVSEAKESDQCSEQSNALRVCPAHKAGDLRLSFPVHDQRIVLVAS